MSRRRLMYSIRDRMDRARGAAEDVQVAEESAPEPTEDELAAEYERIFGKKPHGKMKPETIAARIAEHDDSK